MIEEIKEKLLENKRLVLMLWLVLVILIGIFTWSSVTKTKSGGESDLSTLSTTFSVSSSASDLKTEHASSQTESQKVVVDIKGAVKNEGVYELSSGSRVTDVVKLAGGLTEDADKKSVNLAEKVTDEAVIYVARLGENVALAMTSSQASGDVQQEESSDKINLNTATLADLQTISGIGAKRAQDIIAYRDANGGFSSVDDLANVSGIGAKTLEKLKSEVTVD